MTQPFFGTVKFKKLDPRAKAPTRAHESDAGNDVYALGDWTVAAGRTRLIPTGIAISLPAHTYARVADRSSMAIKGWRVGAGVVDASYTGEIGVVLHNTTGESMLIESGQKIAQFIVTPIVECELEEVEELGTNERGSKGFGSSGH